MISETIKKIALPLGISFLNTRVLLLIFLLSFAVFSFHPQRASAQITSIVEPIVLTINPSFPAPNQTVRASIESFSLNLNRARAIRWFVGGEEVSSGSSPRNIIFSAVGLGSSQTVRVLIETEIGTVYTKDVTLRPALVDLIWQADSYTPAFYRGKVLSPSRSKLKVQAIAQFKSSRGKLYDTSDIVYVWKKDGRTMPDSTGRGRDSVTVNGPILLFGTTIEVTAESIDGLYGANSQKTITPSDPTVILYENNPLLGILQNRAISRTYELTEEEITLVAQPYYFSASSRGDPSLEYTWSVNGKVILNPSTDPSSITLRPTNESGGESEIKVTVQSLTKPLQRFTERLKINFSSLERRQNTF